MHVAGGAAVAGAHRAGERAVRARLLLFFAAPVPPCPTVRPDCFRVLNIFLYNSVADPGPDPHSFWSAVPDAHWEYGYKSEEN
jgi:hypothetical protein